MATADANKAVFWQRVGQPFRAVSSGVATVWEIIDFVSFILTVAHGIASAFRAVRRAISDWF